MNSISYLIAEESLGEKRISLFAEDKLMECWIENDNLPLKITEIHIAKVIQVLKPLKRIFYELFNGSQVSARYKDIPPKIGDLEVITIKAEGREHKPAHAQRGFYLKSKFSIILNEENFLGVSKKITNELERERLKNIATKTDLIGSGAIIRTSAENISKEELEKDFLEILTLWKELKKGIDLSNCKKIFNGQSLQKQAENNYPGIRIIEDKNSIQFKKRNGTEQLLEAHNSIFQIKNEGTLYFEKTKALTSVDFDSSSRDLSQGGLNKLTEDGLNLCLSLIRLRNTSGLITIDMPRLNNNEFNERFDQIKLWSNSMTRDTKILGGTKGGVFEIICDHERASLDDTENGISKFVAIEALRELSDIENKNSKLYISSNLNNIISSNFNDELNEIKEKNSLIQILIDNNLDSDNFYLNK